ncbi:hypothetical protein ACLKA6_013615 [Drosophila palustris]
MLDEHKSQYENEISEQGKSEPSEKKKKISVTFATNEVKDACVQLVTMEKMPFAVLDSEPFKEVDKPNFFRIGDESAQRPET